MNVMGRSKKRSGVLFGTVIVSMALITAACGSSSDGGGASSDTTVAEAPEMTPIPGGEIVVAGESEVSNPWIPASMQCDSYCSQRARTFFDSVGAFGKDMKVHGMLAESITPNAEYTEWTITVRPGILFSDGTPVNADAIIQNLQTTGTGFLISKAIVDVAKEPSAKDPKVMQLKIKKNDEMSLTIFTGKGGDATKPLPWPGFASYLAGQWGLIASPAWLDALAKDPTLATKPVGSGPFIVQSYTPRDALVVTKNPNYWMKDAAGVQLPYLDKITFKVIEDSQTSSAALQSGDIDVFSTSNNGVILKLRELKDQFPMTEQTDFSEINYIMIDMAKKDQPSSDSRVRCALSKAINRQEIIDLVNFGLGTVANGVFSPGQEGYLEDNGFDPAQDIEGAKALIEEYKAEKGVTKVAVLYGHTPTRTGDQTAELLKGYWAAIGVDTKIEVIPQDQLITNALFGKHTMYGWRQHAGLIVDSQNFWWNSASGVKDGELSLNFSRINDPIVDENLGIARTDADPAKRKAAAEAVNRQMAKECYQIPYDYTIWATPHKANVMGIYNTKLPDGAPINEGAGFSGQFWMNEMWINTAG